MVDIITKLRQILKIFVPVNEQTIKEDAKCDIISSAENPLNPNLMAYCFELILGFEIHYRIAEKVNYIVDFDYKGTYCSIKHFKMSYSIIINSKYKNEIIDLLKSAKPLLEQLFLLIGEQSLLRNEFSMKNEAMEYLEKLEFYEHKIEKLQNQKNIIGEKCKGQYQKLSNTIGCTCYVPKCQDFLRNMSYEIRYSIEAVSYTHLRAHETRHDLVCRLLLEKKKNTKP
ncbi:hypothetical protein BN3590_00140 [Clostridium sp. C105KSO15]|nr:hypothetical protein BN3590_00140 [Clostridium sp. C105KSO15]